MGQLIKCESASDFIQLCDYFAQTALKAQFLKFNNIDQAKQLAMTAITRGVDMLEVCLAFDIIGGRLCKKSAHMLAELKARGGKYVIKSRTPELAEIEYTYEGQTHKFGLSWDMIKDEDYTKEKDRVTYKPRYLQPHSRSQMLWARLISDSIRAIAPEITGGYYTPEETEDIIDGQCITLNAGALPAPGGQAQVASEQSTSMTSMTVVNSQVDVMISSEQQLEIATLFQLCNVAPENIASSLAKRGVKEVGELTAAQAVEIITALRGRLKSVAGETSVQTDGPITQELELKIQEAIKLCAQVEGGMAITEAVQQHLKKHGLGIHQLTYAEGQQLLTAIEQRQVRLFLDVALNGTQSGKA